MGFAALLQPAIDAAEQGYPVTERVARDWAKQVAKLQRNPAAAQAFLFDGAPPRPGTIHRQPALAAALRSIASDGPAAFYRGWIARDMVDTLRGLGGLHTLEDFSSFEPEYVDPICVSYRDYKLWECPPNGQGVVPLVMAKALEGFNLASWPHDSVERYHVMAEVGRQAFADRDCFIGDPRTGAVPVKELLSETRAETVRARISFDRRLIDLAPIPLPEHRDTAFLAVVDKDRNTVALINSIFDDFGCGIVSPRSGVMFHNRAGGFVLTRGHPNAIAPRKRPLNTIIPALLTRRQGGDAVRRHRRPFPAVRSDTDHDQRAGLWNGNSGIDRSAAHFCARRSFLVESTVSASVIEGLRKLGHNVTRAESPLGTAQAIWIDWDRGLLRGGADGRRDGIALGW